MIEELTPLIARLMAECLELERGITHSVLLNVQEDVPNGYPFLTTWRGDFDTMQCYALLFADKSLIVLTPTNTTYYTAEQMAQYSREDFVNGDK